MKDSNRTTSQGKRSVQVDLGDDLLQDTPSVGVCPQSDLSQSDPPERLRDAEILFNEGFAADAKKILHFVLMQDPQNRRAGSLLEKIRAHELHDLLTLDGNSKLNNPLVKSFAPDEDPERILRQLDRDLRLGLLDLTEDAKNSEGAEGQSSIDSQVVGQWISNYPEAGATDWIDLGIGFLEMEMGAVAFQLFLQAIRCLDREQPGSQALERSTICLLALSLIQQGKPAEANHQLDPMILSTEIPEREKLELFYLAGRAYELMNQSDRAHQFYSRIEASSPDYRDVQARLQKMEKR